MSRRRRSIIGFAFAVTVSLCSGVQTLGQETATLTRHRLLIAERKWALQLALPTTRRLYAGDARGTDSAFRAPTENFSEDGNTAFLFTDKASGRAKDLLKLSVVMETATQVLSATDFREVALKTFPKDARSIKYLDHASVPVARYTTDSLAARLEANYRIATPDAPRTSRNLEAFLVKDDIWARILFTADSINAEEERLFYSVIDSVQFVNTSNPSNSFDFYAIGRAFSAKNEYRRAAINYASAVTLARMEPQFAAGFLHDLVMKAADAYVMTSDLPAAVDVLEYGVTQEPANETLLWKLARWYARTGDRAKTLATLKTAFVVIKKQKEIFAKTKVSTASHWMPLPDISKDPAFKELMKDKTFRDTVKAMKK